MACITTWSLLLALSVLKVCDSLGFGFGFFFLKLKYCIGFVYILRWQVVDKYKPDSQTLKQEKRLVGIIESELCSSRTFCLSVDAGEGNCSPHLTF